MFMVEDLRIQQQREKLVCYPDPSMILNTSANIQSRMLEWVTEFLDF